MFNVIGKGDTFLGIGFHGELNLGVVVVQEVDSKVGLVEGGSAKVDMLLYAGESGGRTWHKLGKRDRRVATGMQQDDALEGGIKGGGTGKRAMMAMALTIAKTLQSTRFDCNALAGVWQT